MGLNMIKIMIVDDSLIIRVNLKKLFQKNGYEVVAEATNGQDAYEKYLQEKPDLTTMDITMPVMDGITALEKICCTDKSAKVIMISVLGQELKIVEALNKGAKHYITKPFAEKDVLDKVSVV
jgi:two-component system chemotaxis response regulator CheY